MTICVVAAGRLNEDIERFAQKLVTDLGGTVDQARNFFQGWSFLLNAPEGGGLADGVKYAFAKFAALVFPNFEMFNGREYAVFFDTIDANTLQMIQVSIPNAILYCIPYTVAVLLIAMFLFSRRNFR